MTVCNGFFIMFKDMGNYTNFRYRCVEGTYKEVELDARFCPCCGGMIIDTVPKPVNGRVAYQVEIPEIGWEIVS